MTRPRLVKRIRRRLWGGKVEFRIYADGSARVRVDHPSNDPAVEFAMVGEVASLARTIYANVGVPMVLGPVTWRDDP